MYGINQMNNTAQKNAWCESAHDAVFLKFHDIS